MALSELEKLHAEMLVNRRLNLVFGLFVMGQIQDAHGHEYAVSLLEKAEDQGLVALTGILNNTEDALEAGALMDESAGQVFAAIRKQLEASHAKTQK